MILPAAALLSLVMLVAVNATGKEKADPPDMEMLEFLGTYQTAGGKELDPLLLEEAPGPVTVKPRQKEKSVKPVKTKNKERKDD